MQRHAHDNFDKHPGAQCLVIVPVFNESGSIRKVICQLRRALPEFDVLVVDDGSTDDTVRQVPPGVPVVSLPFNLGIGGAMQTGYRYAALHGYDVAVQVDGDGQHRPSEVRRLVDHLLSGESRSGRRFAIPRAGALQADTRAQALAAWSCAESFACSSAWISPTAPAASAPPIAA